MVENPPMQSETTLFYKAEKPEICLEPNQIAQGMYKCSLMAKKLLVYAIATMKIYEWVDRPHEFLAEFTFSDFSSSLNLEKQKQSSTFKAQVLDALIELQKSLLYIETSDGGFKLFNWTMKSEYSPTQKKIIIKLNSDLGQSLISFRKGYTELQLRVIGAFKSAYAVRFYEIAKSFAGFAGKNGNKENEWFFERTVEQVRQMFGIEAEEYAGRMDNFILRVIETPTKEVSKKTDIALTFEKHKAGRHIAGFRFICRWKKTAPAKKIEKKDTKEVKELKTEINIDVELAKQLKDGNPALFEWYKDEVFTTTPFEQYNKSFAENVVNAKMIELYKEGKIAKNGSKIYKPDGVLTGKAAEKEAGILANMSVGIGKAPQNVQEEAENPDGALEGQQELFDIF